MDRLYRIDAFPFVFGRAWVRCLFRCLCLPHLFYVRVVSCSREELYKPCWVKYNPNDPHEITQEQYENSSKKVLLVVGIILLCVSVICVFIGIADIAWMLGET